MTIKLNTHNTLFLKDFSKDLNRLSPLEKNRTKTKLKEILENNKKANIKKLKNYPLAMYRLKISNYRLLFNFKDGKAIFTYCKNRRDLY